MESRELHAKMWPVQSCRDHLIRDVRGILQVMSERSLRQFLGRNPVRKRHRAQRRIADRSKVNLKRRFFAKRPCVSEAELHKQVVRVLPIHQWSAKRRFARLKELRVEAAAGGCRLQA